MRPRLGVHGARAGVSLALLLVLSLPAYSLGLERVGEVVPLGSDAGVLSPSGFCYDEQRGAFLVAVPGAGRVVVLDRQGNVRRELGKDGQLGFPRVVAVRRDGTLIIGGRESERLLVLPRYDAQGSEEYGAVDLSAHRRTAAVQPVALFVDDGGLLYVADRGNRQVLVLDRDGKVRRVIADAGEPADVWADRNGKVYVSDPGFGGIRVYDDRGGYLRTLGADPVRFRDPLRVKSVAVDRSGRIFVLLEGNRGIRVLAPAGDLRSSLGGDGLFAPVDLAVDGSETLFVLEEGGNRIAVYRIAGF